MQNFALDGANQLNAQVVLFSFTQQVFIVRVAYISRQYTNVLTSLMNLIKIYRKIAICLCNKSSISSALSSIQVATMECATDAERNRSMKRASPDRNLGRLGELQPANCCR